MVQLINCYNTWILGRWRDVQLGNGISHTVVNTAMRSRGRLIELVVSGVVPSGNRIIPPTDSNPRHLHYVLECDM